VCIPRIKLVAPPTETDSSDIPSGLDPFGSFPLYDSIQWI